MEFFNDLLGSSSCNIDGSIGMNPLTSFGDQIFEADSINMGIGMNGDR